MTTRAAPSDQALASAPDRALNPTACIALADGPVLSGSVGPGFNISLRDAAGSPVTNPAVGPVTIEVDDQSEEHNFHLTGPGVDITTTVEEIGKRTFSATLQDGRYDFICDVHPTRMRGQFTAGTGGSGGGAGGGGTGGTGGSGGCGIDRTWVDNSRRGGSHGGGGRRASASSRAWRQRPPVSRKTCCAVRGPKSVLASA